LREIQQSLQILIMVKITQKCSESGVRPTARIDSRAATVDSHQELVWHYCNHSLFYYMVI
jgi:hypothetical protein